MEERVIKLNHAHIKGLLEYLIVAKYYDRRSERRRELEEKYGSLGPVTDETRVEIVRGVDGVCIKCIQNKRPNCSKPGEDGSGGTLDNLLRSSEFELMTPEDKNLFLEEQWHRQLGIGKTYTIGELKRIYSEFEKA